MKESALQNEIRKALSPIGTFFRANVGNGWQGNGVIKGPGTYSIGPNDVILLQARPFQTGLPTGFSDIFGFVPAVINSEMVGETLPVFTGIEIKTEIGRVRPEQDHFIKFLTGKNARAGIARSVDQAIRIATGK
jgi:hypothetical protein